MATGGGDRWDASGFGAAPLELVDREQDRRGTAFAYTQILQDSLDPAGGGVDAVVAGRIKELWSHVTDDSSFPPPSLSPDGGKEEVDEIDVSADGLTIEVTGTISTYPDRC